MSLNTFAVQKVSSQKSSPTGFEAEGGSSPGGGDSAANPKGGRSLLDLIEKDEINYFIMKARDYDQMHSSENAVGSEIDKIDSQFIYSPSDIVYKIYNTNSNLWFEFFAGAAGESELRWAWTDVPLEDLKDEGQISIESPETKRQLAIQKDNLVLVNKAEFDLIDSESKSALKLHERVIYAIKKLNPYLIPKYGTEPIRRFVRAFVSTFKGEKPDFVLVDAIKAFNIPSQTFVSLENSERVSLSIMTYGEGLPVVWLFVKGKPFMEYSIATGNPSDGRPAEGWPKGSVFFKAKTAILKNKASYLKLWNKYSRQNIYNLQKNNQDVTGL